MQPLEHVVERRQLGEERHLLEGAGDAVARAVVARQVGHVPPAQEHLSARGRQGARDDVEERALARAVRTDEPDELALAHRERHAVERGEAAELLGDAADLEDGRHRSAVVTGALLKRSRRSAHACARARQVDEPAGQHQDHDEEDDGVDEALVVARREELLAERGEQHGAGHRPPEAAQPADHVEDHEVGGEEEREDEGTHEPQIVAVDRAHEPAEEARGDEGERLVAGGGDAHARSERLGVAGAQGEQREAEARRRLPVEKGEGHHGGGEDDVVEAEVAVQPGPEEHRPGDVGDARRPAEDVEGPEDRVHHLGEGEHAQAEVDAAELERDHAEEPREDGGHRAPCEEAEPHRHVELRREERRGVGAERDVAGVAEGQVAHPHDDVERLRVHHVDEDHDGHVEDVGLGERRQRDEGDEDGSKRGGLHAQTCRRNPARAMGPSHRSARSLSEKPG